jgi:dipeptidyl aminopeptidase/acylaminoacyl peptidase
LLPGTFIKSDDGTPSRPCIAVVELRSLGTTCVEMLKGRTKTGKEDGYHTVQGAQFENGDRQRVIVDFNPPDTYWTVRETTRYQRANSRQWQLISHADGIPAYGHGHLEVAIKQTFTEPPLLVASRGSKSRVIWDPNPQLKDIEFPELSVFTWKDNKGREFKGGLFKPANYKPGQRYPLVIQTHGFGNYFFLPDGAGFGNFAAAELATAGIVVLQAGEDCPDGTEEGPCTASVYESAAKQLVADGLVDASKIGIIGFSRSCFYVMETLTTSSLHFKAASVIDGVMYDYLQFLTGLPGDDVMGALPIGEGLQQWMKRSPGFNLEKVNTPLLIRTGEGQSGLLYMWQPYAVLHQLKKPVDLIMLNTDEHAITNPAMRLVAQGGTIDWFRFWLQGYEDPDPAKAEQYKRWREMRKMQEANEKQLRSDSAENTTP